MSPNHKTPRAADWLPAALLLIVTIVMAVSLMLRPDADRPALAWFSPLLSADQAMRAASAAGALVIDRGRLPTSLVVRPDQTDGLARLRDELSRFVNRVRAA